ncbi:MAG: helix-turn-helix domain-containing protein [Alphaproteobacteria bacterium]|nr:helix-turn-helix domain-containing protein [Alphaproteobacteria bacterium]
MSETLVIKAKEPIIEIVSSYVKTHKRDAICQFEIDNSLDNSLIIIKREHKEEVKLDFPLRLGRLLDLLDEESTVRYIHFGLCSLDLAHHIFTKADHSEINLTEKEVAILKYLSSKNGERVSREDLLKAVWNYAKDTETHTIETHIYRLRQKIETDSSKPEILMTDADGYYTP